MNIIALNFPDTFLSIMFDPHYCFYGQRPCFTCDEKKDAAHSTNIGHIDCVISLRLEYGIMLPGLSAIVEASKNKDIGRIELLYDNLVMTGKPLPPDICEISIENDFVDGLSFWLSKGANFYNERKVFDLARHFSFECMMYLVDNCEFKFHDDEIIQAFLDNDLDGIKNLHMAGCQISYYDFADLFESEYYRRDDYEPCDAMFDCMVYLYEQAELDIFTLYVMNLELCVSDVSEQAYRYCIEHNICMDWVIDNITRSAKMPVSFIVFMMRYGLDQYITPRDMSRASRAMELIDFVRLDVSLECNLSLDVIGLVVDYFD